MCGIAGFLELSGAPVDRGLLLRMLRRIEHRGPDGGGWLEDDGSSLREGLRESPSELAARPVPGGPYPGGLRAGLGHQRLAITDLSEAGRQPMSRDEGRWWIVFNGAIYNAPELRAELQELGEEFSTSTDTEVLLAAYVRWGAKALDRFNGMWAFAIWDARKRELFCARDRFAIKPFYYTSSGSRFAFASEPKALRAVRPAEPNRERVRGFLDMGSTLDVEGSTCFASYAALPAGSILRVDARGPRVERWYDLDARAAERNAPGSLADAAARLRSLLEDAVSIRLRADVPIGLLLSGGVDSSGIAGFLARESARSRFSGRTISTRYPGRPDIDESGYIGASLRETGFSGEFIEPSTAQFEEHLDEFMTSMDDLVPSSIFYAEWLLYRKARQLGLPVMLSGQGSDELFAGYEPWDVHVAQLWNRGDRLRAAREAFLSGRRRWGVVAGTRHTLGTLRTAGRRALPCRCRADGSLQAHQRHLLLVDYLPALLAFEDRNAMAFGIEARLPFLDYRVVEFARTLSDGFLLRNGWTKAVLRAALSGIAPAEILRRPTKLGLPGPLEGHTRMEPGPVRDAWKRLAAGGWTSPGIPVEAALADRNLGFRVRVVDAWLRKCLTAD